MFNYISGKIAKIVTLSEKVKLFYWSANTPNYNYSFEPGQFAIIEFPEIGGSKPNRSYSIAGVENNRVEFCISFKEGGAATALLWKMKEGDPLNITEAKGEFVLQFPIANEVCFIATGTGIAPFKPMILKLLEEKPLNKVYLAYGNRVKADILYHAFWGKLEKKFSNFQYIPTLSREKWVGATGYVHPIYQKLFEDGRSAQFYLCGWKEMISESRKNLKTLGYNRKQYFIESYN